MIRKSAVVTGASSGIGHAISHTLIEDGYHVYGLGRNIQQAPFDTDHFTPIICDLAYPLDISLPEPILQNVVLLVNAAGFGRFDPHETLNPKLIVAMTSVNLTAPMVLTQLLLPGLKANQGSIINITSIEALRASRFSALYSATKAGLRAFGQSLFEEVRKAGVNVVTINPDMTDTPFFDPLRFGVATQEDQRLATNDLAKTVRYVLSMRPGAAVTEITIRPQRFGIVKKQ